MNLPSLTVAEYAAEHQLLDKNGFEGLAAYLDPDTAYHVSQYPGPQTARRQPERKQPT